MNAKLILKDGTTYEAGSFGAPISSAGEVVFATGMTGYPESITDPSYKGQILILTYPLIGNYGVPAKTHWESEHICVSGLIVSNYIDTPSHFQSERSLAQWFKDENLPLIEIKDTRALTQKIRTEGAILGKIIIEKDIPYYDPNIHNLVDQVSTKKIYLEKALGKPKKTVVLLDCGTKRNIQKNFSKRGVNVIVVPWDTDIFSSKFNKNFDALVISNGPGDPKAAKKTIATVKKGLEKKVPTLGICLGHQILTLAAGGDTRKLKYGHRSQNQPCILEGTDRCIITTQNHGFEVSKIPSGFKPWFTNANDNSNEGIIHEKLHFCSVQFHPEATPGPEDAQWIFDYFLDKI
jgi:carbamoyl-phosphate synthase small subunit